MEWDEESRLQRLSPVEDQPQAGRGTGIFLNVSYVGNRGTHLAVTRQYDTLPAADLSTSTPTLQLTKRARRA